MMEQFMVDGLIVSLCSYRKNIEMYQQLAADGMAIVFYDRIPYGLKMPQVMVDDNVDSYFMVEHLIRLGRKRIVYLQGPTTFIMPISEAWVIVRRWRNFIFSTRS